VIEQPRYSSLSWQPIAFLQSARSSTWARLGRSGGGATSLEDLQGGWKVSLHVQLALEGLKPWPMLEERSGRHHAADPAGPMIPPTCVVILSRTCLACTVSGSGRKYFSYQR
jgi:hypothetical protein